MNSEDNVEFAYKGEELDLFSAAHNWKAYFSRNLAPYIQGLVMEVGAGNGSTAEFLSHHPHEIWYALEPDGSLLSELIDKTQHGVLPPTVVPIRGTLESISSDIFIDTILYIDVLEHIEDDRGELLRAVSHLNPGGRIIVLAPAYRWCYSTFDAAIGHFRRYTLRDLKSLAPPSVSFEAGFYLDAVGLLASLANKLMLKKSLPTASDIRIWDSFMVPCSRFVDVLTAWSIGRSVVAVWQKK